MVLVQDQQRSRGENLMGWYLYWFALGWLVAKSDWKGLMSPDMDCTHAWQNNHCYVCGEDR